MGASTLIFHGAVVLFIGMLLGFPLAKKVAAKTTHASGHEPWRMAHSAICAAGAAMIGISGAFFMVHLPPSWLAALVGSIVSSAYAFTVGVTLAGFTGHRGYRPEGPLLNWIVLACNLVGVAGSLVAGALLILGTF